MTNFTGILFTVAFSGFRSFLSQKWCLSSDLCHTGTLCTVPGTRYGTGVNVHTGTFVFDMLDFRYKPDRRFTYKSRSFPFRPAVFINFPVPLFRYR
jgi:hypothetical protein